MNKIDIMDMAMHQVMEIRTMGIWVPVNGLSIRQCGQISLRKHPE